MNHLVGNVLVVASALLAWAFVALYAARFRWWISEMGRNVMALMFLLAAVCTLALIRLEAGDARWFTWLRLVMFAGIPVVLAWRLWMLVRIVLHRTEQRIETDHRDHVR